MQGRYVIATLIAAAITISLFMGMRYLIIGQDASLTEPPKGRVIDFVRLKQDETVQTKKRKPKKPPKPEEPPPEMVQPQAQQQDLSADSTSAMSFTANVNTDSNLSGGLALDNADGEYLPIVKVAPIYPRRALSRGIEGFVIVEFTVTKNGSVSNPFVVEANPPNIFDMAAVEAAKKFKYKPRVIDGEPTVVEGVQNKITFTMKK